MNNERIQDLINSDLDETEIAKELINWFIIKPDLIHSRYILDRTVFHLLVIKNKPLVLNELLEDTSWKILQTKPWLEIAATPDRKGFTLFHYTARSDEIASATMDVLFKFLPKHVNAPNNLGNTPLHEAVTAQKLWAVKKLVENKCDRSAKNSHNKTALELPEINQELRLALLAIDLSKLKSLDLRFRSPASSIGEASSSSLDSLRKSCPLLSTGRSSEASSSTSRSIEPLHSSLRYSDPGFSESNISDFDLDHEAEVNGVQVIKNIKVVQLLKNLVINYQTNKRSVISATLLNEFNELCTKSLLADDFVLSREPFFQNPENSELIHNIISGMYLRVDALYSRIQNITYTLNNDFLYMLASHISIADSNPRTPPELNLGIIENQALEYLWLLTACQTSHESKRQFDFLMITHRAIGILSSLSLHQLLIHLRSLYPYFDKDQKIVANFIVTQLIYYKAINAVKPKTKTVVQLRFLAKLNTDGEKGLGQLGVDINNHLFKINDLCSAYLKRPLLHNYYILNQGISSSDIIKFNPSFNTIVDQALSKTRAKRDEEVRIIAHELRMLTVSFYQQVSITEFHNKNWEKADLCPNREKEEHLCDSNCVTVGKSTLAPNIIEFTENFNKLSNYFVVKILDQPIKNLKNALQLLIEIGQALCPLNDEQYPDINHLMVISSIFNNTNISRLVNFARDLSAEDNAYRQEIDTITSGTKNYLMMRNVYSQFRTTLPFLGLIKRDITFAHDGNAHSEPLVRAEAFGKILKNLLSIKILINFERTHFRTDFPVFLKAYKCLDEDNVLRASLRKKPRKTDVIHWEHTPESMSCNLNTLIKEYLSNDIIPSVITSKKTYKPKHLPSFLINSIKSLIKIFKREFAPSHPEHNDNLFVLLSILSKLSIAIPELIRVNQFYYKEEELTAMKNVQLLLVKLDELKKSIQPSMPLLMEQKDKNDPEDNDTELRKNSKKRRSSHFLPGYSIFKSGIERHDVAVAGCSSDACSTSEQVLK